MTKRKIIQEMDRKGLTISQADDLITSFLDTLMLSVALGSSFQVRRFGTFNLVHRKEKAARNVKTGEKIIVPAHKTIKFKLADNWSVFISQQNKNV